MKKIFLGLLALLPLALAAQLTLRLSALPVNTPADATIYVAGSFNGWEAGNAAYALQTNPQGQLEISLDLAPGSYEYKFTRGPWSTVEGGPNGGFRPNRTVQYNGGAQTESITILSWEDLGGANSTAAANVSILSTSFDMPQLDRTRRIWLYLPPNYFTSDATYPVLYMHDGQNLFDASTSFSGEWEVDETLNDLFANGDPGVIVVGIDNGGANRINEYTPWPNPQYGGGQGAAYVDFVAQTLKPYIDANYRTRPEPTSTGIMGSSLGGLISLYAALRYPAVFGRAGVFSPSLWFTSDIYTYATQQGHTAPQRVYLLAGQQESSSMAADLNNMYNTLLGAGYPAEELLRILHADGQHSEWYWAREFGAAYQWLFRQDVTSTDNPTPSALPRAFPVPASEVVYLQNLPPGWQQRAQLFDAAGRSWRVKLTPEGALSLRPYAPGQYWLRISLPRGEAAVVKLVKQ